MLNHDHWRQTFFRVLGMAGLAALIAVSFLGIGDWYMKILNANKTIVLDKSLFQESADAGFRIESVIKRALPDASTHVLPLSDDRLLTVTDQFPKDDLYTSTLAVFDVANNRSETILTDASLQSYALSPDKSTLVYHTNLEADNTTVWYDLKNMQELDKRRNKTDEWEAWRYMIDDDRAIELSDQNVVQRDLQGGLDDRVIVKMSKVNYFLNNDKKAEGSFLGKPIAMIPSSNFARLYIQYFRPDLKQSVILSVDAASGAIASAAAGEFQAFTPLRNDGLLLAGSLNGVEGLYRTAESGKPALLVEGTYTNLAVNPARDVIAYVKMDSAGHQVVMVGKLNSAGVTDEFNVYYVPNIVRSLDWSPEGDMLFCVTEGVAGSDVYRFELQ